MNRALKTVKDNLYSVIVDGNPNIKKEYDILLTNDEIMYLTIHIRRVVMK